MRTDYGEAVRNRDRWTVIAVDSDGSLTVSHLERDDATTLPADYARRHVRLGYAATAHGHQGDTVDVSLAVVTDATNHRSLYVGATRGRNENRLYVVTDEPDHARDVLERVLTNDRVDLPAVAQRRNLASQVPRTRDAEYAVATARRAVDEARREAEPHLRPLRAAEARVQRTEAAVRDLRSTILEAPRRRRRGLTPQLREAEDVLHEARSDRDAAERAAAPCAARLEQAETQLREAEQVASVARVRDRLDHLAFEARNRGLERGRGVERSLGIDL